MAIPTPVQTIVDQGADPLVQQQYGTNIQSVPLNTGNTAVYITNVNEYVTNYISSPGEPAGNSTEVQFNFGGRMDGDDGLTYNPTTDSLTVIGNLTAGSVLTNSLKYANGANWVFGGSSYSNANVQAYLPTYTGNLNVNTVVGTLFAGSGANLTNIPGANVTGTVPSATTAASATSATTATTAGSATTAVNVTSAAQPNITSVGTLASLNVTATVTAGNLSSTGRIVATGNITTGNASLGNLASANFFSGNGTQLFSIPGANVSGTVPSATTAGSATTAATVTTNAQPNITSVGTLNGIVATSTVNFTGASNVALGSIDNLRITGGANGQVLRATATGGVVEWGTPSVGTLQDVTTNGNTTDVVVSFTNTTQSSAFSSGAVKISGGLGVAKAIHTNEHLAAKDTIYSGQYADFSSWVIPKFIGRDAGATYIQGALINTNNTGSADWVAYNDSSPTDGTEAWADMGFTGSGFDDPLYTITKANDGYVFVQGLGASTGGNFVLATGEIGLHHDLVFATGGFLEANEAMRLDHERNTFFVGGHAHSGLSDRIIDLDINGNIVIGGNLTPNANVTSNLGSSTNRFKNVYSGNIVLSGTGTAVDASQGNILTNKVTGTQFNFLHGSYSSLLQGNVSATSNLTFTLPSSAGSSGQVMTTDGAGNLAFTTVSGGSNISNGTSNVNIAASNGNVTVGVGGTSNVIVATTTGANITGTLTTTGKIGYASGSTVTQTVNRGNGVTINALAGTIITASASMVATQIDTFSVLNNQVDPNNDIVLVQIVSPNFGVYNCIAQPSSTISVSFNGFYINIQNISGFTTSNEAITIRFMVIKAPNA